MCCLREHSLVSEADPASGFPKKLCFTSLQNTLSVLLHAIHPPVLMLSFLAASNPTSISGPFSGSGQTIGDFFHQFLCNTFHNLHYIIFCFIFHLMDLQYSIYAACNKEESLALSVYVSEQLTIYV